MQRDVVVRQNNRTQRISMVNTATAGEGYKAVFDYQKGIFGRMLWTSKNQILRIVPGNDGTDLYKQVVNVDKWSRDADQTEFLSDTFYMTQTLSNFGESRLDICSNLKPGSEDASRYPESPLNYFCNTIHRTMRAVQQGKRVRVNYNDKWRAWTSLQGSLPFPRPTLLFQAVCIHVNGKDCTRDLDSDESAPLFGLVGINHKNSINDLVNAIVTPSDRRKALGSDNNQFGSLAEAEGNLLFLNSSFDRDSKRYLMADIQASDNNGGFEPTPYNLSEDVCKQLWVPWENMLRYLTVKEQLELLAAEFGADTVNYVFSLDPAWDSLPMPERIAAAGMGNYEKRTTATAQTPSIPSMPSKPAAPAGLSMPSFKSPGAQYSAEEDYEAPPKPAAPKRNTAIDMEGLKKQMEQIKASTGISKGDMASTLLGELGDDDLDDED